MELIQSHKRPVLTGPKNTRHTKIQHNKIESQIYTPPECVLSSPQCQSLEESVAVSEPDDEIALDFLRFCFFHFFPDFPFRACYKALHSLGGLHNITSQSTHLITVLRRTPEIVSF